MAGRAVRRSLIGAATVAVALAVYLVSSGRASDRAPVRGIDTADARPSATGRPLHAAAPVRAPAPRFKLRGTVIDRDGRPVAGATVRLDLEEPGVVTVGDGAFAFEVAGLGGHLLDARTDTEASEPVKVQVGASTPPIVLRLRRGFVTEACVVAADTGEPLPTAEVALVSTVAATLGRATIVRAVDAAGCVAFPAISPSSSTLVARATGMAARRVVVDPRRTRDGRYRIELARGATIAGRVVDDRGQPIANAKVVVSPTDEATIYPEEEAAAVSTDDDGRFVHTVEPAHWFVKAASEGFVPARVAIDHRGTTADLTIVLARGATLRGRVVDARGTGAGGATVVVVSDGRVITRVPADATGTFVVPGVPEKAVRLVAATDEATSEPRDVDPARPTEVVLPLVHDGTITGQVVDDRGNPVAFAVVTASGFVFSGGGSMGAPEASPLARIETSDDRGAFVFRGVERATARGAGATTRYLLTSWYRPDDDVFERTSSAPVEARAGDVVRIILPSPARLVGRVVGGDGRPVERFTVQHVGAPARSFTSPDGAFALEGLRARRDAFDEPGTVTIVVAGGVARRIDGVVLRAGEATDLGVIVMP